MAIQAINTALPEAPLRGNGQPGMLPHLLHFEANTSLDSKYFVAEAGGVLRRVRVQGTVTSDATKTYTYVVTNVTQSDIMTAAGQLFDASPVLTAGTYADLVLDATGVAVDAGDLIKVDFTGGTGSGETAVELVIESR